MRFDVTNSSQSIIILQTSTQLPSFIAILVLAWLVFHENRVKILSIVWCDAERVADGAADD